MSEVALTAVDLASAPRPVGPLPATALTAVDLASVLRRFRGLNVPKQRWLALAGVNRRTFAAALKYRPGLRRRVRGDVLARLARALDELAADAPRGRPGPAIAALVAAIEIALARAMPARMRRALAKRMRTLAIYVVAIEIEIENAEIGRALGCSRENVRQARIDGEDLCDERPALRALIDGYVARLKGQGR